jgi:hypothetical protein
MARGMVSKFQPCLPEDAEDRLLAEKLLDHAGTLAFLGTAMLGGVLVTKAPAGARLSDELGGVVSIPIAPSPKGTATPKNTIEWVATPAALRVVCEKLAQAAVLGLDVETARDFGTLCLVQVATPDRTYIIDPFAVGDLVPLQAVFGKPMPTKVIHNARFERRVLAQSGVDLAGVFDTLEASRRLRGKDVLGGHSLAMVSERELGLSLDKSEQTSDWSRRPLDADQVRYAALDAEILILLHSRLRDAAADQQPDLPPSELGIP